MKALELLGRLSLNMCIANPMERIAISGTDVYEAIAELEAINLTRREWYQKGFNEAMKQRTCDGCDNNHKDRTIFYDGKKALMCTFCKYCAVSYFKQKDNA